ncbi:PA14 domain hypothetical carbohydrate binding [Amphidinium carterae]
MQRYSVWYFLHFFCHAEIVPCKAIGLLSFKVVWSTDPLFQKFVFCYHGRLVQNRWFRFHLNRNSMVTNSLDLFHPCVCALWRSIFHQILFWPSGRCCYLFILVLHRSIDVLDVVIQQSQCPQKKSQCVSVAILAQVAVGSVQGSKLRQTLCFHPRSNFIMTKCQVGVVVLATFGFAVALSNSIDAEACPSSSRSLMQVERGLRHRAQKCTYELNATDKKCAHEHPDRLFREEGHNTSTCYEQCKATANCHYFSISLSDQYAGVCMGCIEGVVETHAPFQFYSMCTTMTTTVAGAGLSGMVGGLQVMYYYLETAPKTVDVLDGLVADITSTVSQINYAPVRTAWSGLEESDRFGAKWTGGLRITTGGVYTLELRSDDGSVLMLDGAVVIDNDGLHGMRTKTVDLELSAGDHPLVVKFFENGGIAGAIFSYSGPDTNDEEVVVPSSVLVTPEGVEPPTTTTTTAIALSDMVGGLQVEYYYFDHGLQTVSVINDVVADVTSTVSQINYAPVRTAWSGLTQSDNFGAKWTGGLRITTAGVYTLDLRSDDGSVLMLDGAVVIDNDGLHGMRTKTVDIELSAGDHPLVVKFFENGGIAGVILKYSGPDTGDEDVVVPSSVFVTPAGVEPPTTTTTTAIALSDMVGGLQVEYYYFDHGLQTLSVINDVVADVTSTVSQINYAPVRTAWSGLTQSDKFGAKWTGGLRITTAGVYTLDLNSDDGTVLMLDGAVVIDNDGLHGMRTKTVDIELSAGDHPLVVKFFENGGIAGVILKYSGPDTGDEDVVVPSSVFVTPAGVEPPTTTTTTAIALSDMVGGLQVEYYYFDHGLQTVSVINDVVADVTSTVSQINYAPVRTAWSGLTQSDNFGAKWTGGLRITTAGVYTLDLNSDDGSVLMLDGAVVIDNDGLHGMRTKTVDIELSAGDHPLVVKFFENGGIAGVILKYSGPDTGDEDVVVPGSALLTPAGVDPPPPYMCPADPLANIVSASDYCEIPEVNRMECGWSGISQAVCEARGCCFRLKEGGPEIPECYCAVDSQSTTTTTKPWSCPAEPIEHIDSSQPYCSIPEEGRQDCGWPYITQQLCEYRGCCWNDFNIAGGDEIPRCFCATNAGDALLQNATALRK